jgi:hypothetical protein
MESLNAQRFRRVCALATGTVAVVAALTLSVGAAGLLLRCVDAVAATPAANGASGATSSAASGAAAASAGNPGLVASIASGLGHMNGVRAQFTQTQTLAAMREPLVSTGSLLFFRARGVIWHIDTPYKTTYVIDDAGVSEVNADGQHVQTTGVPRTGGGAQGVAQVSRMMRAMFGGDLSALYAQFDVDARGTPQQWRMLLKPNQPQLAQAIRNLQMSGGAYLQQVRITLANGDVTQIDFTRSSAVDAPTPAERELFGASS